MLSDKEQLTTEEFEEENYLNPFKGIWCYSSRQCSWEIELDGSPDDPEWESKENEERALDPQLTYSVCVIYTQHDDIEYRRYVYSNGIYTLQ